jgi:hypothetical protein
MRIAGNVLVCHKRRFAPCIMAEAVVPAQIAATHISKNVKVGPHLVVQQGMNTLHWHAAAAVAATKQVCSNQKNALVAAKQVVLPPVGDGTVTVLYSALAVLQ